PCLLTTVTTACGFLGLTIARIDAIRDFGMNVAIGVVVVWLLNLVFLPTLLSWFGDARLQASEATAQLVRRTAVSSAGWVVRWRPAVAVAFAGLVAAAAVSVPKIDLNQFVNGEVAADTPMRVDQRVLEQEFGGFLGPELAVVRKDGRPFDWERDLKRLRLFEEVLRQTPDVDRVASVIDYIPAGVPSHAIAAGLQDLRQSESLGLRMRTLVNEGQTKVSFTIHVSDNGTKRSEAVIGRIREVATSALGDEYQATLYGGWYLGQTGMQNVSRDMLMSFATSMLLVLPILALALWSVRLFIVSLIPNLLPMVFALAFSVWVGIPIRIGTAMVLAIAFGIAVDDTIHTMIRLKAEQQSGRGPVAAVISTTAHTGVAILFSSVVLIAGFLTMVVNDVFAIRDMGILASATLLVAFLSDVYLAPALYVMTAWSGRSRTRSQAGSLTRPATRRIRTSRPPVIALGPGSDFRKTDSDAPARHGVPPA
ncbi:MAG: MMPL family transporter, partial [Rhodothermales bacterium]|nr:MMPL family transporter [Rhodothermales bacterium]